MNNQPYGWGVLYDSEGEKKYEGFVIGEAYVCYGTRYYPDIRGWSTKENGVKESAGDEAFSMIGMAIQCLKASG